MGDIPLPPPSYQQWFIIRKASLCLLTSPPGDREAFHTEQFRQRSPLSVSGTTHSVNQSKTSGVMLDSCVPHPVSILSTCLSLLPLAHVLKQSFRDSEVTDGWSSLSPVLPAFIFIFTQRWFLLGHKFCFTSRPRHI